MRSASGSIEKTRVFLWLNSGIVRSPTAPGNHIIGAFDKTSADQSTVVAINKKTKQKKNENQF